MTVNRMLENAAKSMWITSSNPYRLPSSLEGESRMWMRGEDAWIRHCGKGVSLILRTNSHRNNLTLGYDLYTPWKKVRRFDFLLPTASCLTG